MKVFSAGEAGFKGNFFCRRGRKERPRVFCSRNGNKRTMFLQEGQE